MRAYRQSKIAVGLFALELSRRNHCATTRKRHVYGKDGLRWRSQELNIKLHDVAAELVAQLPSLLTLPSQVRGAVDHLLMTLGKPE